MSNRPRAAAALLLCTTALLLSAAPLRADELPATVFESDTRSRRIVLVPPNLGVRAEPEVADGVEPVWSALLDHFRAQDLPVAALERESAAALWREVMAEATAEQDAADVYAVYARFARRIAEQADCGAIVFPSLVTRVAKVAGRSASWDGVNRYLTIPGKEYESVDAYPEGGFKVTRLGVTGEMAAASLHVAVLSPRGELRFEGAGGLALLQRLVEGDDQSLERVARTDAWDDAKELRDGVAVALRKPLPAARAR